MISIPMSVYNRKLQKENKYLNLKVFIRKCNIYKKAKNRTSFNPPITKYPSSTPPYSLPGPWTLPLGAELYCKVMRTNEFLILRSTAASSQLLVVFLLPHRNHGHPTTPPLGHTARPTCQHYQSPRELLHEGNRSLILPMVSKYIDINTLW